MILWEIVGGCSLLLLTGIWICERLPRWRAAKEHARRESLTEGQFGERFFPQDQAQIAARLRRIASDQLGKDLSRLQPEDSLARMLTDGFDSLASVELLMAIEEEFGIELDDAAAEKIATFRDLVNAVVARRPFLVKWRREMGRATEEQFGVRLPRETLAKVATPIELADAVAAELNDQVKAPNSCQSQRAFHLLRSALVRTLNVPRSFITPATPLVPFIGWRTASSAWLQLKDAVAAQRWPPLARPRWMHWLVYGGPVVGGVALAIGLPPLSEWASSRAGALGTLLVLASELRAFILIPLVIFSWVLLVRLSSRFCRALPRDIRTVGDLVPFVMSSAEMTWSREQIERTVRDIVVAKLLAPAARHRAGDRFVEELGLEAG